MGAIGIFAGIYRIIYKMSNQKNPNNEVDLSQFFERERPVSAQAVDQSPDFNIGSGSKRKQISLVWVVAANFIIGTAIFSYYIIK